MKNFGSWKIIDHEKSLVKFLVQKNIMSDRILDPKKSWDLRNFGTQKIFGPEKFVVPKNFGTRKIFGPVKFLVPKNIDLEKFWIWKYFSS